MGCPLSEVDDVPRGPDRRDLCKGTQRNARRRLDIDVDDPTGNPTPIQLNPNQGPDINRAGPAGRHGVVKLLVEP